MLKKIKSNAGNYLPALRSVNYRLYFIGQGISLIGTWMASVAEQWLIYPTLTNNQSLLGIASMLNLLPTTILVLFAGVFADRVHKRLAVIITQSAFAIISFILSVLVFTHTIQIWHVLLATFIGGIFFAFDMPVRSALMLELVNKDDYPSAVSLNSGVFNVARALGPAFAGFTIAAIGIAPAYFLNALSFLAVIASVFFMTLPPHVNKIDAPPLLSGLKELFSHIKNNKTLILILALIGTVTLFTWPINTLLPVFAHDIYNVGEIGFGLMVSFFGIGAVIGAFGFSKIFHSVKSKYGLLVFSCNLTVLASLGFAFIPSFQLTLIFMLISGWATSTFINLGSTLVQLYAPNELRGRVSSLYSLVLVGPMPFGALYASYMVNKIGPRFTVGLGISMFAAISLLIFYFFGRKINASLQKLKD